jgi:hypothetical protein
MLNEEWIEMFRVLPPEIHNQIVVVLQNGSELSIDTFFRFEPKFLVARGRVAGTTDENRAFFVPYNQMLYYRIERIMKLEELEEIFLNRSETPPETELMPVPAVAAVAAITNGVASAVDPTATRNALLERIRAARAGQAPQKSNQTQ